MTTAESIKVTRGMAPGEFLATSGDTVERLYAIAVGGTVWVFHDGAVFEVEPEGATARPRRAHRHESLSAPMPATVIKVAVQPGDAVRRGDVLVVLEAMKMELPVRAPGDGRVSAVHCRPGQLVAAGVSLIDLE